MKNINFISMSLLRIILLLTLTNSLFGQKSVELTHDEIKFKTGLVENAFIRHTGSDLLIENTTEGTSKDIRLYTDKGAIYLTARDNQLNNGLIELSATTHLRLLSQTLMDFDCIGGKISFQKASGTTIDANGRLGIGERIPRVPLHVRQEVSVGTGPHTTGIMLENESDGFDVYNFEIGQNDLLLKYSPNSYGDVSTISYFNEDGAYVNSSDKRLKENIHDLPNVLPKVMELRPKFYNYKHVENKNQKSYGFIAQEVSKVMPDVVRQSDSDNYYGLCYADFSVIAIKAIQEQQTQIQERDNKIEHLQTELKDIKEEVEELKHLLQSLVKDKKESIQTTILESAKLGQNIPNPFNENTKIPYAVPQNSLKAVIQIHGINGQPIKTIPIDTFGEGVVEIETQGLSNGQYVYTLEVDGRVIETKKMNLVR